METQVKNDLKKVILDLSQESNRFKRCPFFLVSADITMVLCLSAGRLPVSVCSSVTEAVHVLVQRRCQGVSIVSLRQGVCASRQEQTHHLIVAWEAHAHIYVDRKLDP